MKQKILILAGIPWNTTIQRHHNIANFLSEKGYDVYFVEKIPSSSFTISKFRSVLLNKGSNNLDVPTNGINVCTERFVNPHGSIFEGHNKKATRKILQKVGLEFDLVITYLPISTTFLFLKQIKYKSLIYDCVRDFENWGGYPKNLKLLEGQLFESADLVLTDSYYLTEKVLSKVPSSKVLQFLPDVDFKSAEILSEALPKKQIKKIVYFGAVSKHIDHIIFNVLSNLDYEIHLIGSIDSDIREELSDRIICHGFVNDLEQLSQLISEVADAIIIPYKGNMDGVIPAKLMQCIVSGLPIFINKFYDSEYLSDLLYVYDSHEKLLKLIEGYAYEEHMLKKAKMKDFYESYLERNDFNTILEKIRI